MSHRSAHHGSRRIGVGNFTVQASRPFNRRFFDSLDRQPARPRRVAVHLTVRLGDLDQFRTVLQTLRLAPTGA